MKKQDPAFGLSQVHLPNLALNALVKVVGGKFAGCKGNVVFARSEKLADNKNNVRLTIQCEDKQIIVDMEDIEEKYETLDITLFMPEAERAAFEQRIKELQEFGWCS